MGIEAILSRIREDATAQAEAVRAQAHLRAEAIHREGDREAEAEYQRMISSETRAINREKEQKRSQSLIKARQIIRQTREAVISQCFDDVSVEFSQVRERYDYRLILEELIREGSEALGTKTIHVSVSQADRALAEEIVASLRKKGRECFLSDIPVTARGGAIISDSRGIRVDNTFDARLERYRKDLLSEIAVMLFRKE